MPQEEKKKGDSFEKRVRELETLVNTMENPKIPLEDLISSYEKANSLVKLCEKKLEEAKKRVNLLHKDKEKGS